MIKYNHNLRTVAALCIAVFLSFSPYGSLAAEPSLPINLRLISPEIDETTWFRLLAKIESNLPSKTKSRINFISTTHGDEELVAKLVNKPEWDLAIIPSHVIRISQHVDNRILFAAFEAPFAFSYDELLRFQKRSYGRVALSALSQHGILGFSYINSASNWLIGTADTTNHALSCLAGADTKPKHKNDSLIWAVRAANILGANDKVSCEELLTRVDINELRTGLDANAILATEVDTWIARELIANVSIKSPVIYDRPVRNRVAIIGTNWEAWNKIPYDIRLDLAEAIKKATSDINAQHAHEVKSNMYDWIGTKFGLRSVKIPRSLSSESMKKLGFPKKWIDKYLSVTSANVKKK